MGIVYVRSALERSYIDAAAPISARAWAWTHPGLLPKVYGSQRFAQLGLTDEKEFAKAHKKGVELARRRPRFGKIVSHVGPRV